MISKLRLVAIILVILAFPLSVKATTISKPIFCGCSTLQGAKQFVLSQALPGYHSIEVININTGKTWFITYEYFPRDYPKPTIDSAMAGTAYDNALAIAAITAEEKPILIVITPDSPLFGLEQTMIDYQPERFTRILDLKWLSENKALGTFKDDSTLKILEASLSYYFGHGPKATIVFPDGSSLQVYFDPLTGAIKRIKGSGRNPNGTFASFGNGEISNGNNYHIGIGLYKFMLMFKPIYISEVCVTRPGLGYWICTIKTP